MAFRDPFPIEKFENDNTFGNKTVQSPVISTSDPFTRLSSTHTLSSARRERLHFDQNAPSDSLDFVIKSVYNPWQFNAGKAAVFVQKETVGDSHGRILKNRIKPKALPFDPADPPLVIINRKVNTFSKDGQQAIEGYHSAGTNRGYSRKPNGNFYKI